MEALNIYLSGGMTGLTKEDQSTWRTQVQNAIKYGDYNYKKKPVFFDPTQYYSVFVQEHKNEREVFEFDLNAIRRSDLIIVNFNKPNSIGTAFELAIAKERRIPIVGLNRDKHKLHPWLQESCTRMCDNMRELVDYVVEFYLQ